jgi:hypothetical protein
MLIPGLNLILYFGYALSIAHNMIRGAVRPLPEWEDWAEIVIRGFVAACASLTYFIPIFIVIGVRAGLSLVPEVGEGVNQPLVNGVLIGGIGVYSLFALILLTAGHLRYARSDQAADYYALGKRIADVFRAPGLHLRAAILQGIIVIPLFLLTPILALTLLGPFVLAVVCCAVTGYLLGIWARQAIRR